MRQEIKDNINQIRTLITVPALYEQMAEECTELAQVLLKKARKIRGENFTPLTMEEIDANLVEEFTDLALCAEVLHIRINLTTLEKKLTRWVDRNSKVAKQVSRGSKEVNNESN